jgi:iron(III) transport system permease protein
MAYALPHIAMGLAMVTFALEFAPGLYQTTMLLVVAYVAMFLPQTVGAVSDSLRRTSQNLEEASRSLGRSSLATTWRITLPLLRPGMVAGGSLVFLTSMKELPATLLLRPNEFDTLAIRIWAATGEGFYTRASAAALILLAVSAIPLTLVTVRDLAR